jgi:hypothetical protein
MQETIREAVLKKDLAIFKLQLAIVVDNYCVKSG